jgi:hypothetical protein
MVEYPLPEACPPDDSAPTSGIFYRLVEPKYIIGDVSERGSWRKPHKTAGPMKGRTDLCQAHGLSIYATIEDTQRFRDFSPWAARKSVAKVIVDTDDGPVLATPTEAAPSHHDWWTNPYDHTPTNEVIDEPRAE